MITVRLHLDGLGHGWAIVACSTCRIVDKHPALEAFDAPIKCKCGATMNVRDLLMEEVARNPRAPRELQDVMLAAGRYMQPSG